MPAPCPRPVLRRRDLLLLPMLFGVAARASSSRADADAPAGRPDFEFAHAFELARAGGGTALVDDSHSFHSGDRFRLAFYSGSRAHLYLFHRAPGGDHYARLFPSDGLRPEGIGPSTESDPVRLPTGEDVWFQLDSREGYECLVLVVSRSPIPSLDGLPSRVEQGAFEYILADVQRHRRPRSERRHQDGVWWRVSAETAADVAVAVPLWLRHR